MRALALPFSTVEVPGSSKGTQGQIHSLPARVMRVSKSHTYAERCQEFFV